MMEFPSAKAAAAAFALPAGSVFAAFAALALFLGALMPASLPRYGAPSTGLTAQTAS